MSLKRKNDLAFKAVLVAGGVTAQVLTGFENQTVTKSKQRVIVNSVLGPHVSVKARNVIMRTELIVETGADFQPSDEVTPEVSHAALVRQVHMALENHEVSLQARLAALGGTTIALGGSVTAELGEYTCFGVNAIGELELPPKQADRVFRDAWAYNVRCAEMIAT